MRYTMAEIDAEIDRRLHGAQCPACAGTLGGARTELAGTGADCVGMIDGRAYACQMLYRLVACPGCGMRVRVEQIVPREVFPE